MTNHIQNKLEIVPKINTLQKVFNHSLYNHYSC
jgi:hypothetical protein